jgi:peroxiredoxin
MTRIRFVPLALLILLLPALAAAGTPAAPAAAAATPAVAPAAPVSPVVPAGLRPGDKAPDFELTDTAGVKHTLAQYQAAGKIVVLEWFNPDCPFILKHHKLNHSMNETYAAVRGDDLVWLAINSSAPGKQGAGLERNQTAVREYELPFPVLLDESGVTGHAYGAKTTPHMFVIDSHGKVAYVGAIDDDPSPTQLGAVNYVKAAVAAVRAGQPVAEPATKPYGCGVKYAN